MVANTFILPLKEWNSAHIDHFIEAGLRQKGCPKLLVVCAKSIPDQYVHSIPGPARTLKILEDGLENSILNFAIMQGSTTYITLIEPGKVIPDELNERIDDMRNLDQTMFHVIKPENGYHGMVILDLLCQRKTLNDIIKLDNKNIFKWKQWNQESL
jgi:hypothetical protein